MQDRWQTLCGLPNAHVNAVNWIFESFLSPNSYVEILTPSITVLGNGAFGRCLGHKNGVFMNGISTLVKETPESSLILPALWEHSEKTAAYELESENSPNTELRVPWFWLLSFQNCEKYISVVSYSVYAIYVLAAQID